MSLFVPRRLTRYVLAEVVAPSLWALLFYLFVLLMNNLFLLAERSISMGLGWSLTLRMLLYELPKLSVMAIPMATLLGTMIGVGRLSADHEWVAIQSAGLGSRALVRPALLHGLMAFMVGVWLYGWVFPPANLASREFFGEVRANTNLASNLKPGVFMTDLPGVVLYVDNVAAAPRDKLEGVAIHRQDGAGPFQELVVARRGDVFSADHPRGGLELDLGEGFQYGYDVASAQAYRYSTFNRLRPERIPAPAFMVGSTEPTQRTTQDMNPGELRQEIVAARQMDDSVIAEFRERRARVELHQRFALPVAALLFALLAVPMGVLQVRSGKGAGFAVSTLVTIVYFLVFTVTRDRANNGTLPVAPGVWAANGAIVLWILFAFWRLRRQRFRRRGPVRRLWRAGIDLVARVVESREERRQRQAVPDEDSPPRPVSGANRFVSLTDRYVVLTFLRLSGLALLSTVGIYSVFELKRLLEQVWGQSGSLVLVLNYFQYFTPGIVILLLPIACLVGAVVTFTMLARTGELTAMLASGISMRRALAPVVAVTVLLCGLSFLVQEKVAPVTNRRADEIKDQLLGRGARTYGSVPGGRWTFGTENRLYHYRVYNAEERSFQGLEVFTIERETPRLLSHRYSEEARWDPSRRVWELGEGWYRAFGPAGSPEMIETSAAGVRLALDPPDTFRRTEEHIFERDLAEGMNMLQVREEIDLLEQGGYDPTPFHVAFWLKTAQPAAPLVMVLLGLPFAFRVGRRGSLYGVGVALLLVIVYWATFALFRGLGMNGLLVPSLAAWAPNVLYGLLGLYLILYIRT